MLHDSNEAICIELRETWFRDYQVLPMRTHPTMKMHGASGYLLSAIKVIPTKPRTEPATNNIPQSTRNQKGGDVKKQRIE